MKSKSCFLFFVLISSSFVMQASQPPKERGWFERFFTWPDSPERPVEPERVEQEFIPPSFLETFRPVSEKDYPSRTIQIGPENQIDVKVTKINGVDVLQTKVLGQFEPGAGGYADCGYHVLKNGFLVASAEFNEIPEGELVPRLRGLDFVKFIAEKWKPVIVARRRRNKLSEYLTNFFRAGLKEEIPESDIFNTRKVKGLFHTTLGSLAKQAADMVVRKEKIFSFSKQGVSLLQELFRKRRMNQDEVNGYYKQTVQRKTYDGLIAYFVDKEIMGQFINFGFFEGFELSLANLDTFFEEKKQYKRFLMAGLTEPTAAGDWLNGKEMKELWQVWNPVEGAEFFVFDTVDDIGVVSVDDLEALAKDIAKEGKKVLVFAIGTMERTKKKKEVGGTQGHWFAVTRLLNGSYLALDSLTSGDINRLDIEDDNNKVKPLVTYFEGLLKKAREEN